MKKESLQLQNNGSIEELNHKLNDKLNGVM